MAVRALRTKSRAEGARAATLGEKVHPTGTLPLSPDPYHLASRLHGPSVHWRLSPSVITNDTVCTAVPAVLAAMAGVLVGAVGALVDAAAAAGRTLGSATRFLL